MWVSGSVWTSLAVARAIGLTGFICLSLFIFEIPFACPLLLSAIAWCGLLVVPRSDSTSFSVAVAFWPLSSGRSVIRGVKWIFYFYYYDFIVFPVSVSSLFFWAFVSLLFSICACHSHYVFPFLLFANSKARSLLCADDYSDEGRCRNVATPHHHQHSRAVWSQPLGTQWWVVQCKGSFKYFFKLIWKIFVMNLHCKMCTSHMGCSISLSWYVEICFSVVKIFWNILLLKRII